MSFGEFIQNVATSGAVFLGIIYLIGGLIVNLNLTRRGVVEYQILKVKFLAVGLIFLFQFLGVVIFTLIPVVLIASFANLGRDALLILQILSIPSILGSICLLYVWSRYPPNTKAFVGKWWFWFVLSVVAILYPVYILLHQALILITSFEWIFSTILAILVAFLAILAQIYHYSAFYYGRPSSVGTLDPIGMGIPTRVSLICDENISSELVDLGLPVQKNIIRDIYLIDETNEHYIISQEKVPSGAGDNQTYKINKNLVKAILHKPDHIRKLVDKSEEKKQAGSVNKE